MCGAQMSQSILIFSMHRANYLSERFGFFLDHLSLSEPKNSSTITRQVSDKEGDLSSQSPQRSALSEEYDVHHRSHLHFTSPENSTLFTFLAYIWQFLSIKAVHKLLNKNFGHHPHIKGYVYANFCISIIFGF